MPSSTGTSFESLSRQSAAILEVFAAAGFERIAPAILQPADVYLEAIGEDLRARSFVFADPDGNELCLRPDLTVPACRYYLGLHPTADQPVRYAYHGPIFRYQPLGETPTHPREFRQAGIELFNAPDREQAEVDCLALTVRSLQAAGLSDFQLRLGDLGLFHATLRAIEMPERWRSRLAQDFWRPERFHQRLRRIAGARTRGDGQPVLDEAALEQQLEQAGIQHVGIRSLGEIAAHLAERKADADETPLPVPSLQLIEDLLAISGEPATAIDEVERLTKAAGLDISQAITNFRRRLSLLEAAGIDTGKAIFAAEFGRNIAYYTGFVFQVEVPGLDQSEPVAGGGRYDHLLRQIGAPREVPAVGAAIHTERLIAVVGGTK